MQELAGGGLTKLFPNKMEGLLQLLSWSRDYFLPVLEEVVLLMGQLAGECAWIQNSSWMFSWQANWDLFWTCSLEQLALRARHWPRQPSPHLGRGGKDSNSGTSESCIRVDPPLAILDIWLLKCSELLCVNDQFCKLWGPVLMLYYASQEGIFAM